MRASVGLMNSDEGICRADEVRLGHGGWMRSDEGTRWVNEFR